MKEETYLILDNIRSRENVGSIFRTADAARVSKIYLAGITPCPPHPKIAKTSLGAENFVPYEYIRDTWRIVTKLKEKDIKVFALEQTKDSVNIFKLRTTNHEPIALILGNEVKGISPKILKYCDKIVYIPMFGKKESLNVSVSAGIALYQLIRKIK